MEAQQACCAYYCNCAGFVEVVYFGGREGTRTHAEDDTT